MSPGSSFSIRSSCSRFGIGKPGKGGESLWKTEGVRREGQGVKASLTTRQRERTGRVSLVCAVPSYEGRNESPRTSHGSTSRANLKPNDEETVPRDREGAVSSAEPEKSHDLRVR